MIYKIQVNINQLLRCMNHSLRLDHYNSRCSKAATFSYLIKRHANLCAGIFDVSQLNETRRNVLGALHKKETLTSTVSWQLGDLHHVIQDPELGGEIILAAAVSKIKD